MLFLGRCLRQRTCVAANSLPRYQVQSEKRVSSHGKAQLSKTLHSSAFRCWKRQIASEKRRLACEKRRNANVSALETSFERRLQAFTTSMRESAAGAEHLHTQDGAKPLRQPRRGRTAKAHKAAEKKGTLLFARFPPTWLTRTQDKALTRTQDKARKSA